MPRTASTSASTGRGPTRRPDTGERLDDVLVFRVDGPDVKELLLADDRGVYFTTPHWNGYPAVLVRIPHLRSSAARSCATSSSTRG